MPISSLSTLTLSIGDKEGLTSFWRITPHAASGESSPALGVRVRNDVLA